MGGGESLKINHYTDWSTRVTLAQMCRNEGRREGRTVETNQEGRKVQHGNKNSGSEEKGERLKDRQ